jgi:hypothetical protein
MEDSMQSLEILEYARQLHDVRGDSAILEAAQKATACEAKGNAEEAANWRSIQSALTSLKGPRAS